jgi:hypothetical protein
VLGIALGDARGRITITQTVGKKAKGIIRFASRQNTMPDVKIAVCHRAQQLHSRTYGIWNARLKIS